jgi:hypothetical protein
LTPKIFGLRLCIHRFHRSDNDRHFHDHPWNYISWILRGGYWENQSEGRFWRKPGEVLSRGKLHQHFVELSRDASGKVVESWSLILFWGKRRIWGFWTETGFVTFDTYDCR